jgi:hypothetical protein
MQLPSRISTRQSDFIAQQTTTYRTLAQEDNRHNWPREAANVRRSSPRGAGLTLGTVFFVTGRVHNMYISTCVERFAHRQMRVSSLDGKLAS